MTQPPSRWLTEPSPNESSDPDRVHYGRETAVEDAGSHTWADLLLRVNDLLESDQAGREDPYDQVCSLLAHQLHAEVGLLHRDSDGIETIAASPTRSPLVGALEAVVRARDLWADDALLAPFFWSKTETAPTSEHLWVRDLGAEAVLICPMTPMAGRWGVIAVLSRSERTWTSEEVSVARLSAVLAGHSLTERAHAARVESLERQKSEFLATTNHELRTPLASIVGNVELLSDGDFGPLTQLQQPALETIQRNVARLQELIENLLLLSRIEAKGTAWVVARVEVVDLTALLRRVVDSLRPEADKQPVSVSLTLPDEPMFVRGDRTHLERAFRNLVSNGIKFSPKQGEVLLGAEVRPGGPHESDTVRVSVCDNGIGIPAGDLPQVFTRFRRGSNATALSIQGTGTGMAITKAIIDAHEGSLEVCSTEGVGSRFTVILSCVDPPGGQAAS